MQIGILVDSLNRNDLSINILNKIKPYSKGYVDPIVFFQRLEIAHARYRFGLMASSELWGFKGTAIATSLNTAELLLNCISPQKKYLYLWDLEWMKNDIKQCKNVDYLYKIYNDPNLHLIAKSKEHYDIIKSCWKEPVGIVEGFDYERLIELVSE